MEREIPEEIKREILEKIVSKSEKMREKKRENEQKNKRLKRIWKQQEEAKISRKEGNIMTQGILLTFDEKV